MGHAWGADGENLRNLSDFSVWTCRSPPCGEWKLDSKHFQMCVLRPAIQQLIYKKIYKCVQPFVHDLGFQIKQRATCSAFL